MLSGRPVDPAPRYFIGVADVPLAADYDVGRLEAKADAGADFVQTQMVFDVDAFGEWADRVRPSGVFERMFVLAGVAVPRGPASARYMRDHLPGVVVPDGILSRLEEAGAEAAGLSVTFAASAYPTNPRAWSVTGAGSEERGGTTSAVTQNTP